MEYLRQLAGVALVFALLGAALWTLRMKRSGRLSRPASDAGRELLRSRGRLALSAQHSVHCVRIGQRDFVLGVHPAGITLLAGWIPNRPPDRLKPVAQSKPIHRARPAARREQ